MGVYTASVKPSTDYADCLFEHRDDFDLDPGVARQARYLHCGSRGRVAFEVLLVKLIHRVVVVHVS